MKTVKLEVRYRDNNSKHRVKTLRREGSIPGSLYGKELSSVPIEVDLRSLAQAVRTDAGVHAIIDLKVEGGPKEASGPAVIKEIQKDYLGKHVVHVAMQQVSMKEKMVQPVTVVFHGNPIGVSRDAGILEHVLEEVEVRCLPADLPPHLDVEVADWEIGQVLHAGELSLPSEVELVTDTEAVVAMVRAPHLRKELEEVEAAVEAEEEEAPAAETEEEA